MISIYINKKKNFIFKCICLQNTCFFRDLATLDGSDFYSTHRVDLDTPLHDKKTKTKKKIFWSRKGGGSP